MTVGMRPVGVAIRSPDSWIAHVRYRECVTLSNVGGNEVERLSEKKDAIVRL